MTFRALLALVASWPLTVTAGAADPPLLPDEADWVMRYDDKVDGAVKDKPGTEVRWRLSVRNDRVSGRLTEAKESDPTDHRIGGEVVAGQPPVVALRQDGPKGLVCFYAGKRVAADRIVGTWYDNRGAAGDFELTVEKK